MKILQITNSFYPVIGGQEKVALEVSKGLVKKNHEITVLTSDYLCKGAKRLETFEGMKIIRLQNKFWLVGYGYSPELKQWLRKNYFKFDVVHCHGYNRYMAEFGLKFLKGKIPLVFTPHGFIHTKKNILFKKIHDLTIGRVIGKANFCTALTALDYGDYKKLGVKREKIIEVPNGIDVVKFSKENNKEVLQIKKKYEIDKKTLLYVGRIHESKGLQYVLSAIKDLDVKLVIVGKDAGYKQTLDRQIKNLNIGKKVTFVGLVEDKELVNLYQACPYFISFAEWEGFGITIIEAMAAGCVVVASDRGSLPFLIENGKNGLMVKFRDVGALKRTIEKVLGDVKLREKLVSNAKTFAKKYSWKSVVDKLIRIYGPLVKHGK